MVRLSLLALRRPRAVLLCWAVAIVALSAAGLNVRDELGASNLKVKGTESAEATNLKERRFNEDVMFVMLRGPQEAVDAQGQALAKRLAKQPGVKVLAPWPSGTSLTGLRPARNVRGLVVSVRHRDGEAWLDFVPRTEKIIRSGIRRPVAVHTAGSPNVGHATLDAAVDAGKEAEKLAAPVLVIVLLLVFGSPLAAALPLVMGASTVAAGYGLLALISSITLLHPLAATLCAMLGLALGVDYSLLLVSRFREELAGGATPRAAAETAVRTAGRAVLFAGAALIAAMTITAFLAPSDVIVAGAVAVIVATVLSVVTALIAAPSGLTLLGANVNRWQIRRRRATRRRGVPAITRTALARPVLSVAAVVVALIALSPTGFALKTSPPTADLLPGDERVRADFDTIRGSFGPGAEASFEIVVDDRRRPVTDPRTLRQLAALDRRIAADKDVAVVAGLGALSRQLDRVTAQTRERAGPAARSGYFALAAIDVLPQPHSDRAGFVLNVDEGGHTARMLIIPKSGIRDERTKALQRRLERQAHALGERTGTRALVGGFAPSFSANADRTRDRIPIIVLALAAMTFLILVPLLRSVVLPLIAVLLNVATVGVTFGALALLFNTGFLGGPGYTDVFTAATIITVIFGLAIDYEVFILARVREEYLVHRDTREGIARGLEATGRIVTGAATIMIAVFAIFALSDLMAIRQFGVGLAIAVALDAFVVRLFALPALMRVIGDAGWWLPGWLDRLLPQIVLEGEPPPPMSPVLTTPPRELTASE